jgi:phosphopantothenate---cysteine ligase (ATP)
VDPSKISSILPVLKERNEALKSGRFLMIPFTTLTDYLWLLRASAASMATLGPRAMLYLAAAVSDFYLPLDELVRNFCPQKHKTSKMSNILARAQNAVERSPSSDITSARAENPEPTCEGLGS